MLLFLFMVIGSISPIPYNLMSGFCFDQVFQRIDILSKDFDNIVELQLGTPWPFPPIQLTATLAHKFEILGKFLFKFVLAFPFLICFFALFMVNDCKNGDSLYLAFFMVNIIRIFQDQNYL